MALGLIAAMLGIASGTKNGIQKNQLNNEAKQKPREHGDYIVSMYGKKGFGSYDIRTGHKVCSTPKGWEDLVTHEIVQEIKRHHGINDQIKNSIHSKNSEIKENAIKNGDKIYETAKYIDYLGIPRWIDAMLIEDSIPLKIMEVVGEKNNIKHIYNDAEFRLIVYIDDGFIEEANKKTFRPRELRLCYQKTNDIMEAIKQYNTKEYEYHKSFLEKCWNEKTNERLERTYKHAII